MVNEDFKREIISSFTKGFEEAVIPSSDTSSWRIKEKTSNEADHESEFFVLTISSQLFRIFVLMHFSKSEETEKYVSDIMKLGSNSPVNEDTFYDCLGEIGNAFCGSMKRDISKLVPSLGMSTPNRLGRDCLKYMSSLKINFETHAIAEYNDNPLFYASAYLVADETLEFTASIRQENESELDSGELEFF